MLFANRSLIFLQQVVFLLLVILSLIIIVRLIRKVIFRNKKIRFYFHYLDVVLPFCIYFIYVLTINQYGASLVPLTLVFFVLIGIVLVLYFAISNYVFLYSNFFRSWLRIGDIYFLLVWMGIGASEIYFKFFI